MSWEEPRELDSDDEAVISMYDGIRRILSKQKKSKIKNPTDIPSDARRNLYCGRILKVDVERKLVVITIEKSDGELRQLRIEATKD